MNMKTGTRLLGFLLCLLILASVLPTMEVAAETVITSANITITHPVGGENPDFNPVSSEPEKYYADVDSWGWMFAQSITPMGAGATFKALQRYDLRVIFRPKAGYTFAEDCVFTINGEETGCYALDSNVFRYIYLYAMDPLNPTYTVSFNPDGGSGTMAEVTGVFDNYILPWSTFTAPAGKFFSGWWVGGYLKDPGDAIHVLDNTTLCAGWKDIPNPGQGYTVSFAANGGVGTMVGKTDFYGPYTLPACTFTAPIGMQFVGWMVNGDGRTRKPGDIINVTLNANIVALWDPIPATDNTIYNVSVSIMQPSAGATSVAGIIETTNKYNVSIGWSTTADGSSLNDFNHKTFEAGTTYYADLYLVAQDSYSFAEGTAIVVNGKAYEASWTISASYKNFISVYDIPFTVPDEIDSSQHSHTPSAWRTNQVYHYKVCTSCGDMLDQEDHKGGTATCSKKGICTVCGYAYIEENEKHNPDTTKWTACGDLYHAHLCKDCGAHAIIEDHQAGPAATETNPQKCTVCGYILVPAKNHKHNLTKVAKVDATCTTPGNMEYYTCDGCSERFSDSEGKNKIEDTVIAPLGHKVNDDWNYDENHHWHICTGCNEVLVETKLSHEMNNGICNTCGYDATEPAPEHSIQPGTEAPSTATPTPPAPPAGGEEVDANLIWLWVLLAVLVVAGGGFALYWFLFRKK